MEISTPAIVFPAISMLMVAYTSRFMVITQRIRSLYHDYRRENKEHLLQQIDNLNTRIVLIRWMQAMGVISFLFCCVSILLVIDNTAGRAMSFFVASIIMLMVSLSIALYEIAISTRAIELELKDIAHKLD